MESCPVRPGLRSAAFAQHSNLCMTVHVWRSFACFVYAAEVVRNHQITQREVPIPCCDLPVLGRNTVSLVPVLEVALSEPWISYAS